MNGDWRLIDYGIAEDMESDDGRTTFINSEPRLRDALTQLSRESPRIVHLVAPAGDVLVIGISARFGSLSWVKHPVVENCRIAIGGCRDVDASNLFQNGGMEQTIDQEQLLPLDAVLEAVSHFFRSLELPPWMKWRAWNSAKSRWEE